MYNVRVRELVTRDDGGFTRIVMKVDRKKRSHFRSRVSFSQLQSKEELINENEMLKQEIIKLKQKQTVEYKVLNLFVFQFEFDSYIVQY